MMRMVGMIIVRSTARMPSELRISRETWSPTATSPGSCERSSVIVSRRLSEAWQCPAASQLLQADGRSTVRRTSLPSMAVMVAFRSIHSDFIGSVFHIATTFAFAKVAINN